MKTLLRNILLIALLGIMVKCNEDEVTGRDYPRLKTLPVTEITSGGAQFNAEILFRGEFEILNYGFVWGRVSNPTVESNDRVIYTGNVDSRTFSGFIESTLEEQVQYTVRAFIETEDYIIYGENERFLSLGSQAPRINNISPINIFYNDTIQINGTGFSYLESKNQVKLGDIIVPILNTSDTIIMAIVPDSIESANPRVFVSTLGNITEYDQPLQFISPSIESISNTKLVYGDTIQIEGNNFGPKASLNTISINNIVIEPISVSSELIDIVIPLVSQNFTISIKNSLNQEVISETLEILNPVTNQILPSSAYHKDEVMVSGESFGYLDEELKVYFNQELAVINSSNNNQLFVVVPDGIINPITVKVEVGDVESNEIDFYNLGPEINSIDPLIGTWQTELTIVGNNFSETLVENSVKIDGVDTEVIASSTNELQIKIPDELGSSSSQIEIIVGRGSILSEETIVLEPPIYESISSVFSTDINELITINGNYFNPSPELNSLSYNSQNIDIVSANQSSLQFRMNESVLRNPLVTEEITEIISYSNAIGSFNTESFTLDYDAPWTILENLNFGAFSNSFQIGNKGYVITQSKNLYEYDFENEKWSTLSSFPGEGGWMDNSRYRSAGFAIADKIYFGLGYVRGGTTNPNVVISPRNKNDFWVYDTSSNSWSQLDELPFSGPEFKGISFDGSGYMISGEVYKYNHVSNTWSQLPNITDNDIENLNAYIYNGLNVIYSEVNSNIFHFAHYDEVLEDWVIDYSTSNLSYVNDSNVIGDKIYIVDMDINSYSFIYGWPPSFNYIPYPNSFNSRLLDYNPESHSLTEISDPENKIALIPFSRNGILYGDGLTFGHQFYMLDPNF